MIRILKVTTVSKKYLRYFEQRHPDTAGLHYEAHKAALEHDSYAELGLWKRNLEARGGYQLEECYIDYAALQHKWALQQSLTTGTAWLREVLEAQIAAFKPDVIYEDDAAYLNPAWRSAWKKQFPFIRHFVAWDGYIKSDISRFEGCDLVLTCVEVIRQRYLARGFRCGVLPFGFDPVILDRLTPQPGYGTTFVGNIIPEIHHYRLRTLYRILRASDLEVWISNFSGRLADWKRRANYYRQAPPADWPKLRAFERLNRGEAFGLKMYGIFHHSAVTLNIHGDGVTQAGNMRLIEACGSGACLVTDNKPNISDYFIPDEEIVVFSSGAEAVDKIHNLSRDKSLRQEIARRGQQRVLKDFSFSARAGRFDEFLRDIL